MCGRFVQAAEPEVYADFFSVDRVLAPLLPASWNVAPTDPVYAVTEREGERILTSFDWGLVPWWAKDRKIGARHINARAEGAATAAAFKESLAGRRCLIPADGFYEWQVRDKGRLPYYVRPRQGNVLALAGLWASWKDPDTGDRVRTCTILTGRPNEVVAPIHDRMPVILAEPSWEAWLDPDLTDPDAVAPLLTVAADATVDAHPVSTLVNKVANNVPELILPLHVPEPDQLTLGIEPQGG